MNSLSNKTLRTVLFLIDIGFVLYWISISVNAIPHSWVFQNYDDPIVKAWNWSFFPLDIAASITGIIGLRLGSARLTIVSATLTMVAGGMAIAFWALQRFFDAGWWFPNAILFIVGLVVLVKLVPEDCGTRFQEYLR
jgi:hypothetical protein